MNQLLPCKEAVSPADATAMEDWTIRRAIEILETRLFQNGPILRSPQDVRDYLKLQLMDKQQEVFAVLFLDCQHRVLAYEPLFYGTVSATYVYPRRVLQRALTLNAAAVVLAHNHPSGSAKPSQADKTLTKHLQELLSHVDIKTLDHFIIGEGEAYSFAEHGLLD